MSTDLDLGHTVSDMLTLRISDQSFRIPDAPAGDAGIAGGLVLILLWCSARERRVTVSVDMWQLSRVRWVSRENRTACVESGATGRALESALAAYSSTPGHWIASWASRTKRQRNGNIEEMVTAASLVRRAVSFERVSLSSNLLL